MVKRVGVGLLVLVALVITGAVGFYGYSSFNQASLPRIGGPFTLRDGDDKQVSDSAWRGKWMLIYFGYTHCPDACPTALNDMALALDKIGDKRKMVQPIFITVDPERDTPPVMKAYVSAFSNDLIGLTGTSADIAGVNKLYHVYAAKHPTQNGDYDMDHSSVIYVMDPHGQFVTNFTHETSPEQMATTLNHLVTSPTS